VPHGSCIAMPKVLQMTSQHCQCGCGLGVPVSQEALVPSNEAASCLPASVTSGIVLGLPSLGT